MDGSIRDLRHAVRSLARTPGFTAVAVLTLALAIGANTAIFSVVHALLLSPLPYKDSSQLVQLALPAARTSTGTREVTGVTTRELLELRARATTLSHVGVYAPAFMTLSGHREAARLEGWRVEPATFHALGVQPLLGRPFDSSEGVAGADAVVILSYATWQRHFGGDPKVLGQAVRLANSLDSSEPSRVYTVIGVMPDGFEYPFDLPNHEFWLPLVLSVSKEALNTTSRLPTIARLGDDASMDAAATEVNAILREISGDERSYELVRVQDELIAPVRPALLMLTVAVGFVLLIACVNLANLLLVRTTARQREIAIRMALGAGRSRVIRQLLTEAILLALMGGVVGIVLAWGGVRLLRTLATTLSRMDLGMDASFPRLHEITIDVPVLGFSIATAVLTGVLFGLAPALYYSRFGHIQVLRQGAASAVSGFRLVQRHYAWGLLVVAEIAMAMMLLVGGGLLMGSFLKLVSVDPGYEASGVLTFQVALPEGRYSGQQLETFAEELVARLRRAPGVQAAAYAPLLPMVGLLEHSAWFRRTPDLPSPEARSEEDFRGVSHGYFDVMGIGVLAGRGLSEQDRAGQPRVLVINQALARRDFPGENPIGKVAYLLRDPEPWRIVGVVEDVRQSALDEAPKPQVFVDSRQWPGMAPGFQLFQYYTVRTNADSMDVLPSVRAVVRRVDPQAGVYNVAPMARLVASTISRPRLYAVLVSIFAAVALMLAAIGLYGTMAYSVAQRTREIGIRMALGAQRSDVMGLVLRQSLVVTAVGILFGVSGAAAVTRYLEGLLFGLTPLDATTFLAAAAMFVLVAALASYAPARRAMSVDPLIALRHE